MRAFRSTLIAISVSACAGRFVSSDPGTAEAAHPVAAVSYPNDVTAKDGWRPLSPADSIRDVLPTVGRDAFRAKIIGADAPRLVLYFNAHIAPQISTWSMPRKDLLELKIADTSSRGGTRSTVAVLSVQSEFPVEPTTGHRNVDEIVTSQIELLLTRDLVTAGATVKDKGLLYRLTANRVGAHELAGAELEALKADVDIVIEATFELSPASADGLSLQLRALRTRDAQILGIASTVDLPTHTDSRSVRPVAGTGYDDVVVRTPIALSSRVRRTLDRLLGDVAARY